MFLFLLKESRNVEKDRNFYVSSFSVKKKNPVLLDYFFF